MAAPPAAAAAPAGRKLPAARAGAPASRVEFAPRQPGRQRPNQTHLRENLGSGFRPRKIRQTIGAMNERFLIELNAGTDTYPWAAELAADWQAAGFEVKLETSDKAADWVLIRAWVNDQPAAESGFNLFRREFDTVHGYGRAIKAGRDMRKKRPVDLEDLLERSMDRLERNYRGAVFWNSPHKIQNWLKKHHPLALAVFDCALNDALLLLYHQPQNFAWPKDPEPPRWQQRLELRLLLTLSRKAIFEFGNLDSCRSDIARAIRLAKQLGEKGLTARTKGVLGVLMVERNRRARAGFALIDKALREAEACADGAAVAMISADLAVLKRRAGEFQAALDLTERASLLARERGWWIPPFLRQQQMLYRALVKPDQETITPLVEEFLAELELGAAQWYECLSYLDRVHDLIGTDKLVELLTPMLGEENARNLSSATHYGEPDDPHDHDLREDLEARLEVEATRQAHWYGSHPF